MKHLKILFWLSIFLLSPLHAQQNASPQTEIINNIHAMWKAIEKGNLPDYMQYIHPQYSLFGEGDAYLHKGKDKEAIDIGDFINRAKGVRTFMHQPEVVVRGDTAWITYYWSDAGTISGERYTSRGKSTRIFVKESGKWLCIHSHFTELP
jgi:ketosteroid isomerase-like protein